MNYMSHEVRAKMAKFRDQFPPNEGENKWLSVS